MSAGQAAQTYSILTIGDGLVAQIPALFIAICAGMIVTRVSASDGGPSNVGQDIGTQILAQPRALLIGAAVALGMALIPGMPTPVFLALAVLIAGIGLTLQRAARRTVDEKTGEVTEVSAMQAAAAPPPRKRTGADAAEEFAPTVPLLMDVAASLQGSLAPQQLDAELIKIRRALYIELGVPFPGIALRFNEALPDESYQLLLAEVPVSQGRLRPNHLLVREKEAHLKALGIPFETDRRFLPNLPTIWVGRELQSALSAAGITALDPGQVLTYHLAFVLKKHAADFIGIQETRFLLTQMEARYPDLVKEALRVLPVQKMAEILQRLVSEDVSVRNLRAVLESLIDWGQKEKDSVLLTEYVRGTLRRYISHKYAGGQNLLPAYLLAPAVEDTVRAAVRQTSAGSYLALDPAVGKRLVERLKTAVGPLADRAQMPVLLTSMDIRRYLRKLIETELYDLPVLSYQELTGEVNIQPLARVEL
jgi:type III secretion protein V